jgi:hypothetical protein
MMESRDYPDKMLSDYIARQISQGQDPVLIREFLIKRGYQPDAVDAAMGHSQQNMKVVHEIHLSGKTLIIVFFMLLGIGLSAFAALKLFPMQQQLLDYQIQIDKPEYMAGDTLVFFNRFSNMGKGSYDITVDYSLIDISLDKKIRSWGETIAVDMVDTNAVNYALPKSLNPGEYRIEGNALYGKQKASAFQTFNIADKSRPSQVESNNTPAIIQQANMSNVNNLSTGANLSTDANQSTNANQSSANMSTDLCSNNILDQGEETTDCGGTCSLCQIIQNQTVSENGTSPGGPPIGETPSYEELLASASELAFSNPTEAISACKQITYPVQRDNCYIDVARKSNQSKYCEKPASINSKDSCYLVFVAQGNYDVCEDINDIYIRMNCESLRAIRKEE